MTKSDFITAVYASIKRQQIKELAEILLADNCLMESVFDVSLSSDGRRAFHCGLVFETLFIKDAALLDPVLDELCSKYNQIKHYSVARSYGKILANIYRLKEKKRATPAMLRVTDGRYDTEIIDGCFKQLTAEKMRISVAGWQLQLLTYFMTDKHAWIKSEVLAIAERMSQTGTPSVAAFIRKYSSKIAKL